MENNIKKVSELTTQEMMKITAIIFALIFFFISGLTIVIISNNPIAIGVFIIICFILEIFGVIYISKNSGVKNVRQATNARKINFFKSLQFILGALFIFVIIVVIVAVIKWAFMIVF